MCLQFTDNTLQPLGLIFRPAYILLHASADPPAGLAGYGGFDTYGEAVIAASRTTPKILRLQSMATPLT